MTYKFHNVKLGNIRPKRYRGSLFLHVKKIAELPFSKAISAFHKCQKGVQNCPDRV